jgi:site-specific DNA-cytosine methylase
MTIDWQTHYRDNWAHKLNINFTANRGRVIDGMYNRAMGFDLMFMLMLKHRSKDFDIIETGTTRTPDNWTDGQADSNRYKQMGNAVAVPVAQWIIDRMVANE